MSKVPLYSIRRRRFWRRCRRLSSTSPGSRTSCLVKGRGFRGQAPANVCERARAGAGRFRVWRPGFRGLGFIEGSGEGKGNSNCHGARPVHLIITMIKWIRPSRLSLKNSLWWGGEGRRLPTASDTRSMAVGLIACGTHTSLASIPEATTTSQKCEAVPRSARI